jgi:hypothetical protein
MTQEMLQEQASGATTLVAQGEALIRIENENMLRVAVERPRDEGRVLEGALRELDLVPEEAASAYYSIPYKDEGRTVHVEGPSIKAAMALARRWGNCTPRVRVDAEDAQAWTFTGVFTDYETSFRVERPFQALKYMKRRDGKVQLLAGKQLEAAFQAGVSKALRNVILAGLPAFLIKRYFQRAKELVAVSTKVPDIIRAFKSLGVQQEQLERHLELPVEKWMPEDVATLRGVYTAIKDGATTAEETFGTGAVGSLPEGPQVVTPESLAGATVTAEEGVEPSQQHPMSQTERSLRLSLVQQKLDRLGLTTEARAKLIHEHTGTLDLGRASGDGLVALGEALEAQLQQQPARPANGRGKRSLG